MNRTVTARSVLKIEFLILLILAVVNCGGGGGGPAPPGETDTLSGVAAGGAPLVGTVTVRDSAGETLQETVALDGTFTFDVTGMTPPFVVWAEGTVNGVPATYYSTCDSDGQVNITPLTHLAMAMALGQDPADYYQSNPNAAPPEAGALDDATQTIGELLTGMYSDLGIPADFDLLQGEFAADSTGFDQLLDMISVTVDDNTSAITEKESDQVLFSDDDMSDDEAPVVVPPVQVQAMTTGMAAAREYFSLTTSVYADGVVDAAEREAIAPWLATGIINQGQNHEQLIDALGSGGWLPAGISFADVAFHRLMYGATDHPLGQLAGLSEKGNHDVGFWCTLRYRYGDRGAIISTVHGFVWEDGRWKNFGTRIPFDDGLTILPLASHFVYYNGAVVQSGLALSINDAGFRGQALGVQKVAIVNDALPEIDSPFGSGPIHAVIMAADDMDVSESIFRVVAPANLAGRTVYLNTDDAELLDNLATNTEFLHVALDANDQPILAWTGVLFEQPHPIPYLYKNLESDFPTMTSVGSAPMRPIIPIGQLSGGPLLSWSNLSDTTTHPSSVIADWRNGDNTQIRTEHIYNRAYDDDQLSFNDWTSQLFSPPPGEWSQVRGRLTVSTLNPNGHVFSKGIEFWVGAPGPITYSASMPFISYRTLGDGSQNYNVFVGLMNNGQTVDPASISQVSIIPSVGDTTTIDTFTLSQQKYYQIDWDNDAAVFVLPNSDSPNGSHTGVNFTLPSATAFAPGTYTVQALVGGTPIEKACPIGAQMDMPVIGGLQAQWGGAGELTLNWEPPADTANIDQMVMWLSSEKPEGGYRVVLRINLSGSGLDLSQITIPAALIANIKILKDPGTVYWSIDTRRYTLLDSEPFETAGSQSAFTTITGW